VNNTAIQLIIPDEVRGRVMSVMMMTFGLMPLGAVPAGIAAESLGAPAVSAVSAGLFALSVVAIFAVVPALRGLDRSLSEDGGRPAAAPYRKTPAPVSAGEPPLGR
jgi:hypothetical protein